MQETGSDPGADDPGADEAQPTDALRNEAEGLLAVDPLRAADALQLAAALTWCGHKTRGRCFIGSDGGLAKAAETGGFSVVRRS